MDTVIRANQKVFKEAKDFMCDALRELFKDDYNAVVREVEQEREDKVLIKLINKKLSKGKSVEEIAEELEQSVKKIQELM